MPQKRNPGNVQPPRNLKALLCLSISLLFGQIAQAQWADAEDYFSKERQDRHFLTLGYGEGRTQWYSKTEGYALYDRMGKKVLSGDHRLSAVTDHQTYQIGVTAPVGKIRVGMGIEFDEFSIYQIHVKDPAIVDPVSMIDRFRFDKIHLTAEYPTLWIRSERMHFDLFMKGGYYAFSKVSSFSLFNHGAGKTFYGSMGGILAYQVYKKAHLYLRPSFVYRHFDNSDRTDRGSIYHDLFSYGVIGGLRYQLL